MNKLSKLSKPVAYKFDQLKAKKPADTKTRAAEAAGYVTDDNSGGYYVVECQECGEVYPSQECDGGGQIADSGDYNDALCPHCGCESPDECNDTPLVWNVQQAKINALLAELEAKDKRIAELEAIATEYAGKFQKAQDAAKHLVIMNDSAQAEIAHLKTLLATPVRFPDCDIDSVSIMAHWYTDNQVVAWVAGVAHAKNQIRAAGFKVEGDE